MALSSRTDTETAATSSAVRPAYSAFPAGLFDGAALGVARRCGGRASGEASRRASDGGEAPRCVGDVSPDYVPDVVLSDSMNRPSNSPPRSV